MSYKIGRDFEYRVIKKLKELGIEVIRNKLSRKPDLWTSVGLFEVKKTIKKGKIKCFVYNLEDYLKSDLEKYEIKNLDIKDYFYTLTFIKRELVLIIPNYLSLDYKKYIDKTVNEYKKKIEFYNSFKEGVCVWGKEGI